MNKSRSQKYIPFLFGTIFSCGEQIHIISRKKLDSISLMPVLMFGTLLEIRFQIRLNWPYIMKISNIYIYIHIYIYIYVYYIYIIYIYTLYIYIYTLYSKKVLERGELRGILCAAWSSLFRALGTWYRRCTRRGLSPRGGGVHFRNEKSFRTRGPQNRFGMKIIAAVSSLPAIHS